MRLAFLAFVLLVAASCGGGSRPASGPQVGQQRAAVQVITIENATDSDLRIFARYQNSQALLGTARGYRSTPLPLLDIPANAPFRLIGRPTGAATGGGDYVSETIQLAAGQRVTWTVRSVGPGMIMYGARP